LNKKAGEASELLDSLEPTEPTRKEQELMNQYRTESHQRVAKHNNFFTEPDEIKGQNLKYAVYANDSKKHNEQRQSNSNLTSSQHPSQQQLYSQQNLLHH